MGLLLLPIFLAFHLSWAQQSLEVGRFINPPDASLIAGDYSTDQTWSVGQTQTLNFSTAYTNYTIALWQQSLTNSSAMSGPQLVMGTYYTPRL